VNELLFAFADFDGDVVAGSGFTARSTYNGNVAQDRVVDGSGTYEATAATTSSDRHWAMLLAGFKGKR
jgi:hypothetical protein